jgi:hypothetical protein
MSIFLFLSLKSVIVNFGFLNLFLDIWIRIRIPDPGSMPKLNADPTGFGSETLHLSIFYVLCLLFLSGTYR